MEVQHKLAGMRSSAVWLVILWLAVHSILWRSSFAEIRLGYIDSNRILEGYHGKAELKDKLEKELEKWQQEAIAKKQKIENLIKEFDSQSLMLSEEARLRKRKEIENLQVQYEEFIQKVWGPDGLAKKKNDEVMKPFIDKVNAILQKIGKDHDYLVIFDAASTGLVYTKEGLDLTEDVVAELNKEFAPAVTTPEKMRFWVFKFKELTAEAREWKHGTEIKGYFMAGLAKTDRFKEVLASKFSDALTASNINKKEEEFTVEEVARVGKLAEADIIVTGEVTRVGDKVDITCRVIDIVIEKVVAQESGTSLSGEMKDLRDMVDTVISKLLPKLTK